MLKCFKYLLMLTIIILPYKAVMAINEIDTTRIVPKSTWPQHTSALCAIPTIFTNDAVKENSYYYNYNGHYNYLPTWLKPVELLERAAFFIYCLGVIYPNGTSVLMENVSVWPDRNSTTGSPLLPVTAEHFHDPNSHIGVMGELCAGDKCFEYFENSRDYWNGTNGKSINIVTCLEWFARSLHFVEDLTVPLHADPGFVSVYHQSAEDDLADIMMSSTFCKDYKNEFGIYEFADPHPSISNPATFKWVDLNAHEYGKYRSISDGINEPLGDDDQLQYVATVTARGLFGTAAGFANYFCEQLGDTYCPVGVEPVNIDAPTNISMIDSTSTTLTLAWNSIPGAVKYRIWFGPPTPLGPIGVYQNRYTTMKDVGNVTQYTLTLSDGLPAVKAKWHFSVTAVNVGGWESDFGGWLYLAPVEVLSAWSVNSIRPESPNCTIGDINGDGIDDIIVVGDDGIRAFCNGNAIAQWYYSNPTVGGGQYAIPAVADIIGGDGKNEIIWTDDNSTLTSISPVTFNYEMKIYLGYSDGSIATGWPKTIPGQGEISPVIGDIDGDGHLEIIVAGGGQIYVWDASGNNKPGWPQSCISEAAPIIVDTDNDGKLEIFLPPNAWKYDGTSLSGWPLTSGVAVSNVVGGDLDGDGDIEIIASTASNTNAWHHNGVSVGGSWPVSVSGKMAIADVDNNGQAEIAISVKDYSYTYFYSGNGVLKWQASASGVQNPMFDGPTILDYNNDGFKEILVRHFGPPPMGMGGGVYENVFCWDRNGNALPNFPFEDDVYSYISPVAADLNNDGIMELILGWHSDEIAICNGKEQVSANSKPGWYLPRADRYNTGAYNTSKIKAPSVLNVDVTTQSSITISWKKILDPRVKYYLIYSRAICDNDYVLLSRQNTIDAAEFTDNNTAGGGFKYYVRCVSDRGDTSAPSDSVFASYSWYVENKGANQNATIDFWEDTYTTQLILNVESVGTTNNWVQGPILRKDITDIPVGQNTRVNWQQYDKDHALLFQLLVKGADGVDRWLIYGANASNHWETDPGFVDMGVGQKLPEGSGMPRASRFNIWEKYSRNIAEDYLAEFGKAAAAVKELRIGHYSYTGWSVGDHGGTVKNITFSEQPLTAFNSGFESEEFVAFSDTVEYKDAQTDASIATLVNTESGFVPQNGSKMYKIEGNDKDNTANNSYCYWKLFDIPVKIEGQKYLSFWRYVDTSPDNTGRIFIDGVVSQGTINTPMRDLPGVRPWDQYGAEVHPGVARPDAPGWKQYIINLSPIIGQQLDNIMLAYDDAGTESGVFNAYIDDIQLLDSYPNKDEWYIDEFGSVRNAYLRWLPTAGGGAQLIMDNNGPNTGPEQWTDPYPWLQKDFATPISIPFDRTVTWKQIDLAHSLHFALLIECGDGQDRWLIYSANASNYWPNQGWVNMGAGAGGYNVEKTFTRYVKNDFQAEFPYITPVNIKSLRIGHFSDATWDGDKGGTVRDIMFRRGKVHPLEVAVKSPDALAYNNANKLALSSEGAVHLCYTGLDSVYYLKSTDKGTIWSMPLAVGKGQYPAVAVDGKGRPAMAWSVQGNATSAGIFYSCLTDAVWTEPVMISASFQIPEYDFLGVSPPSMTVFGDTVSLVYEYNWGSQGPLYPILRGWRLEQVRFKYDQPENKVSHIIDSWEPITPPPIEPPWERPTSASIATDAKGNDHITWHLQGVIYYNMRNQNGRYIEKVQLSPSHWGGARNPFISVNGAATVVYEYPYAWANQYLYDVFMATGYGMNWSQPVNMSNSLSGSDPTVCGTEVIWTSDAEIMSAGYDTDKMTYAEADNLSSSDLATRYPHAAKRQTAEGTETYRVWAEEVIADSLWSLVFYSDVKSPEPLYALDAVKEEPSVFTVERDGYIDYNQVSKTFTGESRNGTKEGYLPYKSVDYDSNALVYRFFSFDPKKKYNLYVSFYQETGQDIKLKPYGGKTALGEVNLPSGQEVVMEKNLPAACYKNGEMTLEIRKHKGPFAVCGKILIYEDVPGGKFGGAQSAQLLPSGISYSYALYQNYPNPMRDRTSIHYQLKKPGKVAIKVYNTLGQAVRTLVDEQKPAGYHQAVWNGQDNSGKITANGVYFYRLTAGDFKATKKMVVIK